MTLLTNSFAGGSDTTVITTGNSGGTSGDAFDAVDGSPAFSSTQAIDSTLSMSLAAVTANTAIWWSSSLTGSSVAQAWFRVYLYPAAIPGNGPTLIEARYSGGNAALFVLNGSGTMSILDGGGSGQGSSTTVLSAGAWVRLEGYVTGSATVGQAELKIFLSPESTTATETVTTTAILNLGGPLTALRIGEINEFGGTGAQLYMGALGASDSAYIGPAGGGTSATVTMGSALAVSTSKPAPQVMSLTSPAYASAATDLGGGTGSWVNPGNADGAPDSSYAIWTSP